MRALLRCPHAIADGQKSAMRAAKKKQVSLLTKLCDMVRGNLGKLDRKKVTAIITIEVAYDGPDLFSTATFFGISDTELVQAHTSQRWRVALMGFAPGFGYLEPIEAPVLPWTSLPRRTTPRATVPAGSVALAAGMSAIYPTSSPGGWHLIGTSRCTLFDPDNDSRPTLLVPGATVRFAEIDHEPTP